MTIKSPTSVMEQVFGEHELVKLSDSPFGSLPLFLPGNVSYDPETNTTTQKSTNEDENENEDEDGDSSELVLVPNAGWDMLQAVKFPLSVISCVGPYRTGKSLLMSRFLQTSKAFEIGPTLEGCTRGIWISTSALKDTETGVYKFLLDVEGLGDPMLGDDVSNTRLALASLLLSSVFLFNNTSHPDRGSLQFLKCLATIRQRLPKEEDPDGNKKTIFPTFLWIFRDFFLQLPNRKDTGEPYTLEEYMMERVLAPSNNNNANNANNRRRSSAGFGNLSDQEETVVDSLLHDFANLEVLSVRHPKRTGQLPFGPEEMAQLAELDWDTEIDEGFRADIEKVIQTSLRYATPFQLGSSYTSTSSGTDKEGAKANTKKRWSFLSSKKAATANVTTGKAYAKWCQKVLELVNKDGVIPNLPDLQHQLLQQIADEELQQCIETFQEEMDKYWESCPVFDNPLDDNDDKDVRSHRELVAEHKLKPIAEDKDLTVKANEVYSKLRQKFYLSSISSVEILTNTLKELKETCVGQELQPEDNQGAVVAMGKGDISILSRIRTENRARSQAACQALVMTLYGPVQTSVREDPTSLSVEEFHDIMNGLKDSYNLQARGPAKEQVLSTQLVQQGETDVLFVTKVTEKNNLFLESLQAQDLLKKDMELKEVELQTLSADVEELKVQQQKEIESLAASHEETLQNIIKEREEKEAKRLKELQADLEKRLLESQKVSKLQQEQVQKRMELEIEAREEKSKQEKKIFEEQLEELKDSADKELQEKLATAESKRKEEEAKLEEEMQAKLLDAERKMKEELEEKERKLREAEEEMKNREREQEELKQKIAEIENRDLCSEVCCCM